MKARIELIPMFHNMFMLRASFMMVSVSHVHVNGIKVNLPTGQSCQTQDKANYVSLSVDKDGYIYFDKEKIALEEVYPRLQKIFAENGDAKIFVRGDREALHGNVTRLLDQIRSSGVNKSAFEIKSEAGKSVPQAR